MFRPERITLNLDGKPFEVEVPRLVEPIKPPEAPRITEAQRDGMMNMRPGQIVMFNSPASAQSFYGNLYGQAPMR